ncbi:MAG: phytanoyl-CoA dioxygenase family protein [Pseudomonadota bacterium]
MQQLQIQASGRIDDVAFPDAERYRRELMENGYTIIHDAIPADFLAALREVIERLEEEYQPARSVHSKIAGKTFRLQGLLEKDPIFRRVLEYPQVIKLVSGVLEPEFILQVAVTLCVGPGAVRQPIHTDDIFTGLARPHAPLILNTIWAITDFTEENGATRVVPGSHLCPNTPRPTLAEIAANPLEVDSIPAVMKAGSMLVIDGATWHGAGANQTGERRAGLAISYCQGWMRQQENFQLGTSPELARSLSPRLRQLLGFGLYTGILGNMDGVSPAEKLELGVLA